MSRRGRSLSTTSRVANFTKAKRWRSPFQIFKTKWTNRLQLAFKFQRLTVAAFLLTRALTTCNLARYRRLPVTSAIYKSKCSAIQMVWIRGRSFLCKSFNFHWMCIFHWSRIATLCSSSHQISRLNKMCSKFKVLASFNPQRKARNYHWGNSGSFLLTQKRIQLRSKDVDFQRKATETNLER